MELSYAQKRAMYDDGYLVLRDVVPGAMVLQARRRINHSLGELGLPREELPRMRAQSYCREVRDHCDLVDLCAKTPVFDLAECMTGRGNLLPVKSAQIALRFPQIVDRPKEPRGHIDGIGTGINGVPVGTYKRGFTMLAVILLCDLPEPYSGNFTVWPGSHHYLEQYFHTHDCSALAQGVPHDNLPRGPVQITGKAGDVVLVHHMTVHTAAPNYAADTRYATIYRLRHVNVEQNGADVLTDIWRELPAVGEMAEPREAPAPA